jgi:hypothetical protein
MWCLHPLNRTSPSESEPKLPAVLATLPCATLALAETASAAICLRSRLVNTESTPANFRAIQGGDRFVSVAFRHLHESETARAAGLSIHHQVDGFYGSMRCEERTERVFGRAEIQVAYKNLFPFGVELLTGECNHVDVDPGKTVSTETCTLGPGGFYVECRNEGNEGQLPPRLAIIAYDSHAKVYTSYYANGGGMVGVGTGTVDGNTWTWMVEDKFAGKAIKGRTTSTMLSPTEQTSKYEMADGKGGYTTIVEGNATKVGR